MACAMSSEDSSAKGSDRVRTSTSTIPTTMVAMEVALEVLVVREAMVEGQEAMVEGQEAMVEGQEATEEVQKAMVEVQEAMMEVMVEAMVEALVALVAKAVLEVTVVRASMEALAGNQLPPILQTSINYVHSSLISKESLSIPLSSRHALHAMTQNFE